jgi:hypothetical protein
VLAYHCCQADTKETLDPGLFVSSLAGQLSARLEGFAAAIEHPAIRDRLSAAATGDDPASALESGILAPLSSLPAPVEGVRYLLIDALDEAILRPKGMMTILDLLVTRLERFPPWLKVVATTQPQPEVLQRLAGIETRAIEADDPRNKNDVAAFISARLAEPVFEVPIQQSGLQPAQIKTALEQASGGNFQFATTFLDGVDRGHIQFLEVATLPPGLWSLYRIYFDRLYGDAGLRLDYEPARRVLEVVVSASSPPTASEIAEVLWIDAEYQLPEILQPIAAFLAFSEGTYRAFHGSLSDWLTTRDAANHAVAGKYHIRIPGRGVSP